MRLKERLSSGSLKKAVAGHRTLYVGLLLLTGCSNSSSPAPETPIAHKQAPADPWVLSCIDPAEKTPALLWNGLIGVRIGRDGMGIENGLFAIDEYEKTGEEKILPLPNPMGLKWTLRGETLDPAKGTNYRQNLDMRGGILETTWDQAGGHVILTTAIEPGSAALAERWVIDPGTDAEVSWESPAPATYQHSGDVATRKGKLRGRDFQEFLSMKYGVRGEWKDRGWKGSSDSDPAIVVERYINLAPRPVPIKPAPPQDDVFPDLPSNHWAYRDMAKAELFDSVAERSKSVWAERWKTDIEIDGPVEDQQAVRSFLFYLRSAIHPNGKMSISPFGLSDATYNGHVFWDAEIWVFPALALVQPDAAKAITDYRLAHLKDAEANFEDWMRAGRPTASGKLSGPGLDGERSTQKGAMFPWESSVSGHETVPGPSKWEHHITGDVAFEVGQAMALGFIKDTDSYKPLEEAAFFWLCRSTKGPDGKYEINGTMSPDENHTGDNDLYTSLLAQWGFTQGGGWDPVRATTTNWYPNVEFKLPHDDKSFLTYDGDTVKGYKQAAAVLAIYPLQFPPAEKRARPMMERFADKVSKNGPAMTDSVHSIIWSRLGESQKAYETWRNSWLPFTAHPLMLFSEKRTKDTCYFTTGAAGSLQSVLYGFMGFRLDWKKQDGAAWSIPLHGGSWLSVKPHLPPAWKSVKFKNFNVLGRRYTLTATTTSTDVHVTQGD